MKKLLLIPALLLLLYSCDFMLKERDDETEVDVEKNVVLGNDKDDKGCVTSAGYKWSLLRKECIRVFEEGYRLNKVDSLKAEDKTISAFVVFNKDEKEAELYLPGSQSSFIMKKEAEGLYKNGAWALNTKNSYQLRNRGRVVYAGAAIQENKVISDDWKGGSIAPAPTANDSIKPAE
jgi:hypothetical protein